MYGHQKLLLRGVLRKLGAITTGVAFVLNFVTPAFIFAATPTIIFSDGFESNDLSNWTTVGNKWTVSSSQANSGTKKAQLNGPATLIPGPLSGTLIKIFSTTGYQNITISYWYKINKALENNDHVLVKIWNQSGDNQLIDLADYTNLPDGDWVFASFNLPSSFDNQSTIQFSFNAFMDAQAASDRFDLDDVLITGEAIETEEESQDEENNEEQERATLRVIKIVINDDGGEANANDFPLFINETPALHGEIYELEPGTYTISETQQEGYNFVGFFEDCNSEGIIILEEGDNKVCVLKNNDIEQEPEPLCPTENFEITWASEVKDYIQKQRKDNSAVLAERSDPSKALGQAQSSGAAFDNPVPNGEFFSLGFGGIIALGFGQQIINGPGDDIFVYEITGGTSYPPETVEIFAKQTGNDWVFLGELTRDGSVDLGALAWADFIKIRDISDKEIFEDTADGFDLDAVKAQVCAPHEEEEEESPQNQPPLLSLNGQSTITLTLGDIFTDPGALAFDPEEGDISGNIVVGGDTIDTNTPGTYIITYDVQDSQGASAPQITRTVIVIEEEDNNGDDNPPPQTTHCSDGIDNDNDSLVDLQDPGCENSNDDNETNSNGNPPPLTTQCSDDIDNDGDGFIDTNDPGCTDANDDDETNQQTNNNNGGGNGDNNGPTTTIIVSGGGGGGLPPPNNEGLILGASFAPEGQVLGDTITCGIYLNSYIRFGANNNREDVIKLQEFLNKVGIAQIPTTGFYGTLTYEAVKKFQLQYKGDILLPWVPHGLPNENTPTGYVFKTTQWKINTLHCPQLNLPKPKLP